MDRRLFNNCHFTFVSLELHGQDYIVVSLSLRNVVDLAISQSSAVKYVQNRDVNYYWRWKNHQTRFRPQLTLSGDLPDFENQTKPIVQPDGSIVFQSGYPAGDQCATQF